MTSCRSCGRSAASLLRRMLSSDAAWSGAPRRSKRSASLRSSSYPLVPEGRKLRSIRPAAVVEMPQRRAAQRAPRAIEGRAFGNRVSEDTRLECLKGCRKTVEVVGSRIGRQMGVGDGARKALQARRERPDEDESDVVFGQHAKDSCRIERRRASHVARCPRSGRRSRPRPIVPRPTAHASAQRPRAYATRPPEAPRCAPRGQSPLPQ